MRRAINLNDEAEFDAAEIGDVRADRDLSSEAEAMELLAAEVLPQDDLGRRHAGAERLGVACGGFGGSNRLAVRTVLAPSDRFAATSPVGDGGGFCGHGSLMVAHNHPNARLSLIGSSKLHEP